MNIRLKKIICNILILVLLFFMFVVRSGFYLTPLSAHEHSERSIHYGPSKVVHIADFDKGKYILGKYDRWVSCNTVLQKLFFFWAIGNQPIGFENDKTKPLDFSWGTSEDNFKLYGIINDDRIKTVELTLNNGTLMTKTNFYDDLFLFTWRLDQDNQPDLYFKGIKGYDANNKVVFETNQYKNS